MSFHDWLKSAWTNLLSWFGLEEQKLASFLYPLFTNTKELIKKDGLADIIALLPAVAKFLTGSSTISEAVAYAESLILPILKTQNAELVQTDINILSNGLVAQAQASLDSGSSGDGKATA